MTTSIDKLYDIILSEMTPQPSKQRVGKLTNWGAKPTDGDGNGKTIEATNDDCSKCGIILTDEDMDRENGKCENCWFIWDAEEEEEEKPCEVDKCDAIGKCSLDKCFYEEEEEKQCKSCEQYEYGYS